MKGKMILRGVSGSPGIVVAKVRVVDRNKEKMQQVEPGEVLVGEKFYPEDDQYLEKAAALIQDVGGPASHGNVFAKSKGIPAVSSTLSYGEEATSVLKDGQLVVVDGLAGIDEKGKPYGAVYEYTGGEVTPQEARVKTRDDLEAKAKLLLAKYGIKK